MDEQLKTAILEPYRDLVHDAVELEAYGRALEAMWRECRDQNAFGYSDHYLALVPELPHLFRMLRPLVAGREGFERVCRAMPAILKWTPYYSDESPVGYIHTILTGPFESRAQACQTLDEFIRGFEGYPVSVCSECGRDMAVEREKDTYCLTCTCGLFMVC